MKKILNMILMALVAICFVLPTAGKAEAAKVAVVPLANHVENDNVVGSVYMQQALEIFRYPEFDLLAEDIVNKAVGSETGLSDYSKESLQRIAQETGADIVVAMELDELKAKSMFPRRERTLKMNLRGQFAFLNNITDTYYNTEMYDDSTIEEAVTVRGDWPHEVFQKVTKNYMKKVTKIK